MTDQQLADRFEAAELLAWEHDQNFQQLRFQSTEPSYFLAQKSILETTPARRLRELYPVERENPLR